MRVGAGKIPPRADEYRRNGGTNVRFLRKADIPNAFVKDPAHSGSLRSSGFAHFVRNRTRSRPLTPNFLKIGAIMIFMKTALSAAAIALFVGTGALVASTETATARVVCNSSGDCWHTEANYRYPGTGYTRHNDDWYFHQRWDANDSNRHYRERHDGRGYYKSGVWISF
jgi:hypothetical protein